MSISGVGSSQAMSYLQQLNQVQNATSTQHSAASSDADHDGDVDGAGPDTNDGSGKGMFINTTA